MANDPMACGHSKSLLIKSAESDYQFCDLCNERSMRRDAEAAEAASAAELVSQKERYTALLACLAQESKIADNLRSQLEKAQAEVKRLNEWADSMTDAALKERATGEAYQRELRDTIARQLAWIKSAGHRPWCKSNLCAHPNCDTYRDKIYHGPNLRGHLFQPSPCTCGYSNFVEK